ncbi:helix-turn-helix domain-containing protein [Pedobacter sp. NJ-S-72]
MFLSSIKSNSSIDNIYHIASKHNITPRYLQKLIYQHTGLSAKSFDKINRFQHSLTLIAKNEQPFTSIAYACGYFDQSHFIRDFKSFTGVTPSAYMDHITPVNLLLQS